MPDFTTEHHYRCAQLDQDGRIGGYRQSQSADYYENQPHCTCQSFKFRKTCKHLEEWEATRCTWEQFFDGDEPIDGKCPRCGSDVVVEKYAV